MKTIPQKQPSILEKAEAIVNGPRQDDYGNVTENFSRIAQMWSAILNQKVTPEQVGLCMISVKISRQCHKPKIDNLVDIAGYAATIEKLEK